MKLIIILILSIPIQLFSQECFNIYVERLTIHKKLNTNVGNEYFTSSVVAKNKIDEEKTIKVRLCSDEYFVVTSCAKDIDPSYDDIECIEEEIHYESLARGVFTLSSKVLVTENAGRYAGQSSKFTFVYKITVR
jgi:hypothetical protein